jgi:hypothetical protein
MLIAVVDSDASVNEMEDVQLHYPGPSSGLGKASEPELQTWTLSGGGG